MALKKVELGAEYFPSPIIGRPLASADIYVGEPGLDPKTPANQKQISVLQEDGTVLPIAQPISTGAGGVPVYSGEYVTILVEHPYSLRVDNSAGSQVYYVPTSREGEPELVFLSEYAGSFPDAIGDIGGTEVTLVVDTDPDDLAANLTSPENVMIEWRYPFEVSINTGITFTIYSPENIIAGDRQQIFTGLGAAVFTVGGTVHPEWWGENATQGTTDMTAEILAAYEAVKAAGRGTVKLLNSQYAVADLVFTQNTNGNGITIAGSGQGTKIVPAASHTSGNYLITLDDDGATATQWITLKDMYLAGGGARACGIDIEQSNNCRLDNVTILDFDGIGLRTARAYDLYCDKVRVKSCGSYANSEPGVLHEKHATGGFGNFIFWTDCVTESNAYRQMEIRGVHSFICGGACKIHGKSVGSSGADEAINLLYIDGAGDQSDFSNVLFTHAHYGSAVVIRDEDDVSGDGVNNKSKFRAIGAHFSNMESYDGVLDIDVIDLDTGDPESYFTIDACTFEKEATFELGPLGVYVRIGANVVDNVVRIGGRNFWQEGDREKWIVDEGADVDSIIGSFEPQMIAETLQIGNRTNVGDVITIVDGVATINGSMQRIESQTAGADDLDTISGGKRGMFLRIVPNSANDIVVKHGAGLVMLAAGDVTLTGTDTWMFLFCTNGVIWQEIISNV